MIPRDTADKSKCGAKPQAREFSRNRRASDTHFDFLHEDQAKECPTISTLEAHYEERILPMTAAIADRWGRLCFNQSLPVSDGLIAATGIEHQLTVVARNISDFQRSGVATLNPFS